VGAVELELAAGVDLAEAQVRREQVQQFGGVDDGVRVGVATRDGHMVCYPALSSPGVVAVMIHVDA